MTLKRKVMIIMFVYFLYSFFRLENYVMMKLNVYKLLNDVWIILKIMIKVHYQKWKYGDDNDMNVFLSIFSFEHDVSKLLKHLLKQQELRFV